MLAPAPKPPTPDLRGRELGNRELTLLEIELHVEPHVTRGQNRVRREPDAPARCRWRSVALVVRRHHVCVQQVVDVHAELCTRAADADDLGDAHVEIILPSPISRPWL